MKLVQFQTLMTKISKNSFKKINIDTIISFQQINKFNFRLSRSYLQDKNIVAKILFYVQFWYQKILDKIETIHKMHIIWQIRDHHMPEICVNRISQISPINLHSIKLFMARKKIFQIPSMPAIQNNLCRISTSPRMIIQFHHEME